MSHMNKIQALHHEDHMGVAPEMVIMTMMEKMYQVPCTTSQSRISSWSEIVFLKFVVFNELF